TPSGVVTDTVRRYEATRQTPDPATKPSAARPLEGLTVWYKARGGLPPLLTALAEGRRIGETEYGMSARQVFLPDLAGLLPALPQRVGDRWRVPRSAAQALLGERPEPGSEPLVGTLQDVVRKAPPGRDMVATIGVAGRVILRQLGDTQLNAQLLFVFAAP